MSDKISVVYIGPKPKKKDTITNSRLVFPRHQPVEVSQDIGYQLLDYPTVWIPESDLENHLKIVQEKEQKAALDRAKAEQAEKAEQLAASMVVELKGETIDLAKLNSAKLKTLVAAHELDIAAKSAQEDVDAYRVRIRDGIRAMDAEPATDSEA
ncbi:hypothetical protein [Vibrio sp. ABG19]|uniref:hypothetical protein n=1 Tax=Vibrio sp. ABG19 TaxID=2817385 RepID=UPI00249E0B01|nr:hypothetical protein [Vibrio sp. ABG19]WGY45231.1 hypothetical protein J0X00_05925 [Vibrio sp. ABG19]